MIRTAGPWFKDEYGRSLILRGVNLGGSTKVPFTPDGATYRSEGFFNHRQVSFVGRPFPLDQADEHFERLRAWGFDFLRFLVTWEAIEHAGPGIYDTEYLDYVREVVQKAGEHGISLFIDPHQDVWSRFSGGDGAPGWTLEAVGLDITKFGQTGAAVVHQVRGDPFPRMIWPSNSLKLAAATMFTLFFGGNDFAPQMEIEGVPVQEYLQGHYIESIRQLATRLKGLSNVVGYDTLNEPLQGYIGWEDLNRPGGMLKVGECPSPFQSMLLGAGIPQEVGEWSMGIGGARRVRSTLVNRDRARAWLPGFECIWKRHGVWDLDPEGRPRLLRPDHFVRVRNREVDFAADYYRPFANRYAAAIRTVAPEAIIFLEGEPNREGPKWGPDDAPNIVYAPHWYDGFVLFMKSFTPFLAADMQGRLTFGARAIRRSFAAELATYRQVAAERLGNAPTLIGEFGIAFDMNGKKAYRTGDFSAQIKALHRSYRAMEDNLLSCTLWNYTADNTNRRGDQWNDEDLSLFSRDQQTDPKDIHSGGRALRGAIRPYPKKTAGEPTRMAFDWRSRVFDFEFRHDLRVEAPTEIFVPSFQYPSGCAVRLSDGTYELNKEAQILTYRHSAAQDHHRIVLRPR
jgi:hypothetical protein